MHALIKDLFLARLDNPVLRELGDSARLPLKENTAFTTDSFVVSPLFFPGGDIGKLAVCGSINDLVMRGALPEYLSLAFIAEEGLEIAILEKVVASIASAARASGVHIATGDFKVVEKGAADKLFINTCGVGRIISKKNLSISAIRPKDKIILTGEIGMHGLAVLAKRKELSLGFNISSDCAALDKLLLPVVRKASTLRFMRDPTRGGVATTLNEIAESSGLGIVIDEKSIPVSSKVRAAGELLGIDPLYVANEGKAIIVVGAQEAHKVLAQLKKHPLGRSARIIGSVEKSPKAKVVLKTILGTERIIDMLTSEPLPRIC